MSHPGAIAFKSAIGGASSPNPRFPKMKLPHWEFWLVAFVLASSAAICLYLDLS